jgi:hypothetical protein
VPAHALLQPGGELVGRGLLGAVLGRLGRGREAAKEQPIVQEPELAEQGIDAMKRLAVHRKVVARMPHTNAVRAAKGGGQPWIMLASTCTRRKARCAS